MTVPVDTREFIQAFALSPLAAWQALPPWELTAQALAFTRLLLAALPSQPAGDFFIDAEVAVHRSATIEPGAVIKGPACIGAGCFVAAGAYLRGGVWLASGCTVGPGSELKSSFVFAGSTLAHFNFVGDSVVGSGVNFEAGSVVCNHRNERADKEVRVRLGGALVGIGRDKFGALVGDGCRVGANAVIAPGALLAPGTVLGRTRLFDAEIAAD